MLVEPHLTKIKTFLKQNPSIDLICLAKREQNDLYIYDIHLSNDQKQELVMDEFPPISIISDKPYTFDDWKQLVIETSENFPFHQSSESKDSEHLENWLSSTIPDLSILSELEKSRKLRRSVN